MRAQRHEERTKSKAAKTGSNSRPLARGTTIPEVDRGEGGDILATKLQERVAGARVRLGIETEWSFCHRTIIW